MAKLGQQKNREKPNPLFYSYSHPSYSKEKAADHTQGSSSGCIRQMAGKERRWRRRRKGGLLTAVCTCRKTGKMNRHAVFHTKASSCTTHPKSSNRVRLVVCYIARPVSNARGESELRKSFTSGWFLLYLEGKLLQGHTLFHTHWCWDSEGSSPSIQRQTRNIKSLESFSRKDWMIQIKISLRWEEWAAIHAPRTILSFPVPSLPP